MIDYLPIIRYTQRMCHNCQPKTKQLHASWMKNHIRIFSFLPALLGREHLHTWVNIYMYQKLMNSLISQLLFRSSELNVCITHGTWGWETWIFLTIVISFSEQKTNTRFFSGIEVHNLRWNFGRGKSLKEVINNAVAIKKGQPRRYAGVRTIL